MNSAFLAVAVNHFELVNVTHRKKMIQLTVATLLFVQVVDFICVYFSEYKHLFNIIIRCINSTPTELEFQFVIHL